MKRKVVNNKTGYTVLILEEPVTIKVTSDTIIIEKGDTGKAIFIGNTVLYTVSPMY